jgi:hypothetical protein
MGGQQLSCTDTIQLRPNQSYEGVISVELPQPTGAPARVEFVLLRGRDVYRTLHLWIHAGG